MKNEKVELTQNKSGEAKLVPRNGRVPLVETSLVKWLQEVKEPSTLTLFF
jgi:hypothetical protein